MNKVTARIKMDGGHKVRRSCWIKGTYVGLTIWAIARAGARTSTAARSAEARYTIPCRTPDGDTRVFCSKCGAHADEANGKAGAAMKWNRRAEQKPRTNFEKWATPENVLEFQDGTIVHCSTRINMIVPIPWKGSVARRSSRGPMRWRMRNED